VRGKKERKRKRENQGENRTDTASAKHALWENVKAIICV
jgi:hypothetical protein